LPPDLAAEVVGSVALPPEGGLDRTRYYLRDCHPEAALYGEHTEILLENETLSHGVETIVDVTGYPSDYFLG
jgi:hypothetical protein